jgi:hypothetical protein
MTDAMMQRPVTQAVTAQRRFRMLVILRETTAAREKGAAIRDGPLLPERCAFNVPMVSATVTTAARYCC